MSGLFSVVAINGDWTQFLDNPALEYLRFDGLPWTRAVELLEICFEQGFSCVVMQLEEVDGNG